MDLPKKVWNSKLQWVFINKSGDILSNDFNTTFKTSLIPRKLEVVKHNQNCAQDVQIIELINTKQLEYFDYYSNSLRWNP